MEEFMQRATNVVELDVCVKEVDDLIWKKNPQTKVFKKENLPSYFGCSNPLCHEGGILISEVVRDILKERRDYILVNKRCQGYEESPQGKRICIHAFEITIRICYSV